MLAIAYAAEADVQRLVDDGIAVAADTRVKRNKEMSKSCSRVVNAPAVHAAAGRTSKGPRGINYKTAAKTPRANAAARVSRIFALHRILHSRGRCTESVKNVADMIDGKGDNGHHDGGVEVMSCHHLPENDATGHMW
jgi:hypothetical protein